MAFPALVPVDQVPANVLFPEHFAASKKMITKDFVFFGSVIVLSVVFAALMNLVSTTA